MPPLKQQTPTVAPRTEAERSSFILHQGSDIRPPIW